MRWRGPSVAIAAALWIGLGQESVASAQDWWAGYDAETPRLRGYAGGELGAGVCAAPSFSHPCHDPGLIPEAGVVAVAVYGLDAHLELELGLALTLGLSDSIGTAMEHPLRGLLGLMGEAGLRWHPVPAEHWYLATSARFGLQILTEDFVTLYVDPVTHLMVPMRQTGEVDPRIGGTLGFGWMLGGRGEVDLSARVVVDTASIGLRVALLVRLG